MMRESEADRQHREAQDGQRDLTLLTVRAVAQRLGMSPRWVHERVRRHEIPHFRLGRALRFDLEEVRRWLARSRSEPEEMRRERR
jgi:excisionase family DNA binding protein